MIKSILALVGLAYCCAVANGASTLTVTPNNTIIVLGDELKVGCEISEGNDHFLQLKSGDNEPTKIDGNAEGNPVGRGFIASGFSGSSATSNGRKTSSISVTVVPNTKGKFEIKCGEASRMFYAVNADRQSKEGLSIQLDIPRAQLDGVKDLDDPTKTFIHLVLPASAKEEASPDINRNCTSASDNNDLRYCFKFTPKTSTVLTAGRYTFELRSNGAVLATAVHDVSSNKLEIKDCASTAGSNCIADSEFCSFKCTVVGWPFTNCEVSLLDDKATEKKPLDSRFTVECLKNEQKIRIVLAKPTLEDSVTYNVTAIGGTDSMYAEGTLQIRVKDKLAPLWPFLGICAEVVILCGIILFFEKRHQKKLLAQETEGADASEAMIKKGGDNVRNRGAKA